MLEREGCLDIILYDTYKERGRFGFKSVQSESVGRLTRNFQKLKSAVLVAISINFSSIDHIVLIFRSESNSKHLVLKNCANKLFSVCCPADAIAKKGTHAELCLFSLSMIRVSIEVFSKHGQRQ